MQKIGTTWAMALTALSLLAAANTVRAGGDPHSIKVSVGYACSICSPAFTPTPWRETPGITYVGTAAPYETGGLMLTCESEKPCSINKGLAVDIGPYHFQLWDSALPMKIPGKGSAVFAQTVYYPAIAQSNFDTSDTNTCTPTNTIPKIRVSVGEKNPKVWVLKDKTQILNTNGVDPTCLGLPEGHRWVKLHGGGGDGGGEEERCDETD